MIKAKFYLEGATKVPLDTGDRIVPFSLTDGNQKPFVVDENYSGIIFMFLWHSSAFWKEFTRNIKKNVDLFNQLNMIVVSPNWIDENLVDAKELGLTIPILNDEDDNYKVGKTFCDYNSGTGGLNTFIISEGTIINRIKGTIDDIPGYFEEIQKAVTTTPAKKAKTVLTEV